MMSEYQKTVSAQTAVNNQQLIYQGNINPLYPQTWTTGDPPYQQVKFISEFKPQLVSDIEKVIELFMSGAMDKEMTMKVIEAQLEKHGPKRPESK